MSDALTPRPLGRGEENQELAGGLPAPETAEIPAPSAAELLTVRGWRRLTSAAGTRINGMPYLMRWLVLATIIGAVAGVGAVVFYEALRLATQFFLGFLAGYHVPTPTGEGFSFGSASYVRPWVIPLVVVGGGLLAGFLVFTWAPEAEGHGTDAAIDAVHYNPRGIRTRAVVIKIVASALTIGSGGSGGREGPTAQISAGFGSLLARVLDLSPKDGRIAVSVGIGSGIGAIFSAPLGGAVLAADVVYRDDFEYEALVPGVLASIVAYSIFGAVFGFHPLFATPGYHFDHPIQLLWFAIIGIIAGGIGLLYSHGFYGVVRVSHYLPFSRKLRPAAGGLLVGLMALAIPEVLGTGYGWVQRALFNEVLHIPLWIILLLPFARIAATALSIGTGGSGGVFGPGMVIGAFTGLAFYRLFEPFAPGVHGVGPAPFVVVGMMAVFGGISRAPLAVLIMVTQMTGNLQIVAPAMVAVALSTFIVSRSDDSIYRSQLRTRADSEASRMQFGMPMLSLVEVRDAAKPPRIVLRQGTPAAEGLALLRAAGVPGAPVVDEDELYLGTVDVDRLVRVAQDGAEELDGHVPRREGEEGEEQGAAGGEGAAEAERAGAGEEEATAAGAQQGEEGAEEGAAGGEGAAEAERAGAGEEEATAAGAQQGEEGAEEGAGEAQAGPTRTIDEVLDATTTTVPESAHLDVALEALIQAGGHWVTVTSSHRVVGILAISDLVSSYQRTVAASAGHISEVSPNAQTVEERVGPDSPLLGTPLREGGLPPGCIVVSIQRGTHMLFATGSTVLERGDLVSALASPTTIEAARRMIRGTDEPKPPMVARGSQMV